MSLHCHIARAIEHTDLREKIQFISYLRACLACLVCLLASFRQFALIKKHIPLANHKTT